ncbi:MAG: exodeoxyribonuclease VII small subunit [Saprospiraceae bacterium]
MSAPKDYASAQTELEELLSSLQQPSVEIDSLTEKVARAKELLEWSKQKLRSTEAAIDQLLSE